MSSFTSLTYHVIFATKHRHPTISDFKHRLHDFMGGLIRERKGRSIEIGGVADHVHILARFPPSIAVSDMIREVKAVSSKWINDNQLAASRFEWQIGFAAFTVSFSNIESVQKYIANQEVHHRVRRFEDEYVDFLKQHGIEFDRRFLFEKEFTG